MTNTTNTNTQSTTETVSMSVLPIEYKGSSKDANTLAVNVRLNLKLVAGDWNLWEHELQSFLNDALQGVLAMVDNATDGQVIAAESALAIQALRGRITKEELEYYVSQKASKEISEAMANSNATVQDAFKIASLIAAKKEEIKKTLRNQMGKFNLHYVKDNGDIVYNTVENWC